MIKYNGFGNRSSILKSVDSYLAKGDSQVGYGDRLSQLLNGPCARQFIREAARLKEDESASGSNVGPYVSTALAMAAIALVAASGLGCLSDSDDNPQGLSSEKNTPTDKLSVENKEINLKEKGDYLAQGSHQDMFPAKDIIISNANILHFPNEKTFAYGFGPSTETYVLEASLSSGLADYFRNAPHTQTVGDNFNQRIYSMLLSDPNDDETISGLIENLSLIAGSEDPEKILPFAVSFVEGGIDYKNGLTEKKAKYPYETLFDRTGNCDDKAILLAEIVKHLGFDTVIFKFKKPSHMGIGIKVPPGYGNFGTDYCFLEPADYSAIGDVKRSYSAPLTNPEVIPVTNGGNVFYGIDDVKREQQKMIETNGRLWYQAPPEGKRLLETQTKISSEREKIMAKMEENRIDRNEKVKLRTSKSEELQELKRDCADCFGTISSEMMAECKAKDVYGREERLIEDINSLNGVVGGQNAIDQELVDEYNIKGDEFNATSAAYNELMKR